MDSVLMVDVTKQNDLSHGPELQMHAVLLESLRALNILSRAPVLQMYGYLKGIVKNI